MKLSTLSTLLSAHLKAATIAVVAAAATAGGGLAVATTVADSHAATGLTTAHTSSTNAGSDAPDATGTDSPDATESDSPDSTQSSQSTDLTAATGLVTPAACPSDVANHGAYVSSVAKTSPTPGSSPNAHGAAVSAAARSDCGKPTPQPSSSESSDSSQASSPNHPAQPATSHKGGQSSTHHNHGHH